LADLNLNLEETDLILTSADFGDAYLRDGWASQYVEDRMRINTIVLVGYQAEDAALRLLLPTEKAKVWSERVGPVFQGAWPLDVELQTTAATFTLVRILLATGSVFGDASA
jgi:hypothetical protein